MLFSRTSSTKVKRIFVNKWDYKEKYLVKTTTYWFLFIPVYYKESKIV